ncbi:deoxyribonuclease IV [Cohnella sp. JJ-181]|uniref:deoxyribonuclease IV n=1 Tax=Cohnella rhizoplanae TaxID=2974897 RepID=UPI0022FF8CFE|nr:deoxyribonuclease IV [Cohnella sp. JJ-181]CAI6081326.1 putative endonuclease 4 [Cohnella sp. JJ-181]
MTAVGSHVSTRRGFYEAARTAWRMGGDAFQYFPSNPRTLFSKRVDEADAARCAAFCRKEGIVSLGHSAYAINPAATGESAAQMEACVLGDLAIAEACGSIGTVIHFGVIRGDDPLQGYRDMIVWLDRTLSRWEGKARLLLENQAGNHGDAGRTPEEMVQIRSLSAYPDKIGFCLDTCHLFASGEWNGSDWSAFRERASKLGYWEHLAAVHLNDSLYPSGSRKDRHAPIGEGHIGDDSLRELLATPELRRLPIVMETPPEADGTHERQIARVRKLMREGDG